MKNILKLQILFLVYLFTTTLVKAQNVGINTTGATPSINAILDLNTGNSNNLGLIIPNVSLTALATFNPPIANAVTAGDKGMMVYNTNAAVGSGVGYYYWNGATWVSVGGGGGGLTAANNGLSVTGTTVQLGGLTTAPAPLIQNSVISGSGFSLDYDLGAYTATGTGSFLVTNGGIGNPYYLYISHSGNANHQGHVGIGTAAAPKALLDVEGNTYVAAGGAKGDSIVLAAQNAGAGNANGGNVVIAPGTGSGVGVIGHAEVTTLNSAVTGVPGNKPVFADNNGNLNVRTPPYFQTQVIEAASGTFVVPAGITRIKVYLVGGGGGSNSFWDIIGGTGGYIYGELEVTPAESLTLTVGAGGAGTAGINGLSGGGGGTYIQRGGTLLCGAGGGGGASGSNENNFFSNYLGLAGGQSFGNTTASLAGPIAKNGNAYGTASSNYTGYLEYSAAFAGYGMSANALAYDLAGYDATIGSMPQSVTGIGGNTSYGLPNESTYSTGQAGVIIIYY